MCRLRASLWDCPFIRARISSPSVLIACNDRPSVISKPSFLLMVAMRKQLLPAVPSWPILDSAWSCILRGSTGLAISIGFSSRIYGSFFVTDNMTTLPRQSFSKCFCKPRTRKLTLRLYTATSSGWADTMK